MEWAGEATVIARRKHGENAVILTALTREAGLIRGVVPGGASVRRAAMLQQGNRVALRWRARLDDQLGSFAAEPARARPGLMADADALAGLNAVAALLPWALPERDPHPRLADATEALLDEIDAGAPWAEHYLRWELVVLDELGFGLALDRCAVSGAHEGLAYVSPKTGHAVTAAAAGDWAPRLIPLPAPLGGASGGLAEALALTSHFLDRMAAAHIGKPMPAARARLSQRLARGLGRSEISRGPGQGRGPAEP